jgi:hypothetical protein
MKAVMQALGWLVLFALVSLAIELSGAAERREAACKDPNIASVCNPWEGAKIRCEGTTGAEREKCLQYGG